MTTVELYAHFSHLLGGHATDVDARLGDVDAKLIDALDKMDGLEAAFNSKLDAKFQEVLARLPQPRDNVRRRARRVPCEEVPGSTFPAAAAAPEAASDEGYDDYGGEEELVDENMLDGEEVEQPAHVRPRQLNRNARPPPRPVVHRCGLVTISATISWGYTNTYYLQVHHACITRTTCYYSTTIFWSSTGKTRDIQCRKCLGFGHIERECRTKCVMLVREDGEFDSASDFDEDLLALIAARDGANSDSEREMEKLTLLISIRALLHNMY
ncbi:hypothetical protein QYE76_066880 [Lolium multiflorum]|uniref:CCHC-type domain-containing protein n=1 Tax=Lolium multiflorum TaxID=4521 RepID=A0AAD8SBT7_LOLMU|nr:hypothetical protein QYE76_066880 [Lolium multiflorum]